MIPMSRLPKETDRQVFLLDPDYRKKVCKGNHKSLLDKIELANIAKIQNNVRQAAICSLGLAVGKSDKDFYNPQGEIKEHEIKMCLQVIHLANTTELEI